MTVKSSSYRAILKTVKGWPREYQLRLLEDLIDLYPYALPDDAKKKVTLQDLKERLAHKSYPALRRYSADEAVGTVKLKRALLSLAEEKAVLEQALLEKYG